MAATIKNVTPNYYETLGVEKDASMGDITSAYRKLAMKYHPDRNRGAKLEEATEKFKVISEAYATLSDPSKRRQYDLHGTGGITDKVGMESVEVENVGWLGRFLAAQVTKLGVPIPTTVSAEVLGTAKQYCSSEGKGSLPQPKPLLPHQIFEGKLNLSSAEFFSIQVTEEMASNGFVLACRSRRKNDRFRILVFDKRGDVKHQGESAPSTDASSKPSIARCRLFLAPFKTMSVGAPFPSLDETPPICHSLDTLEERAPSALEVGSHLAACYCDNFLSSIRIRTSTPPLFKITV